MQRRQVFIAALVTQAPVFGGDFFVDLLQLIIDFCNLRVTTAELRRQLRTLGVEFSLLVA